MSLFTLLSLSLSLSHTHTHTLSLLIFCFLLDFTLHLISSFFLFLSLYFSYLPVYLVSSPTPSPPSISLNHLRLLLIFSLSNRSNLFSQTFTHFFSKYLPCSLVISFLSLPLLLISFILLALSEPSCLFSSPAMKTCEQNISNSSLPSWREVHQSITCFASQLQLFSLVL